MISVFIPEFAFPEIKFVIDFILHESLGLTYQVQQYSENNTRLVIGDKSIEIVNCFFQNPYNFNTTYQADCIPEKIDSSAFTIDDKKMPLHSIYGVNKYISSENKYVLASDIISSTFFMLSRWEETISTARDVHNRFRGSQSLSSHQGLLQTPIVNEYIEILWIFIQKIGYNKARKERNFSITPTHDIDKIAFIENAFEKTKKKLKAVISKNSKAELALVEKQSKDLYDQYGLFMDCAEKIGTKAHFFFLVSTKTAFDLKNLDETHMTSIIDSIKSRGHQIGLHPSYSFSENHHYLEVEKRNLEKIADIAINSSRNHFLKINIPDDYREIEKQKIAQDYSLGYADELGFRTGTCYPHKVFDIHQRKEIDVIVHPLLVMDVTIKNYVKLSPSLAIDQTEEIKNQVKKYKGEFCFLWHNSSFHIDGWPPYHEVFKHLYQ